jgi:predicted DNA-binding antitoxin AbrB/MazE fold protein
MRAVKQMITVDRDKSVTVKSLPFKPGSNVEVIVIPAAEEDIFAFMDKTVKKKKIAPMTMKEVEKIVHEARGLQ